MDIKFYLVKKEEIDELAKLASEIWHEYWTVILTLDQINYMVEKFQSKEAIKEQIENENYEYYFIKKDDKTAGYFGISNKKDYLFLSKLYLKKEFRHQGIGQLAFFKIVEIAKSKNYKKIQLTVNKYNKNTINAYLKYGFKTVDSPVTDIGGGFVMDDYVMEFSVGEKL